MRSLLGSAAVAAFLFAAAPVSAASVVDGTVSLGEYGLPTSTVLTDASAPEHNFGEPGPTARAGYNIFLNDNNDTLYGAVQQTGGQSEGSFANFYFDINPSANNGSELGIEITNRRGFVAGSSDYFDLSSSITFASTVSGGLTTTEFSINNSVFRDFIAGAQAGGFLPNYTPENVRLNLSQSLSYSVAGGTTYGSNRLGTFSVEAPVAAVPEPASWAMMLVGFGGAGYSLRRRRRAAMTMLTA